MFVDKSQFTVLKVRTSRRLASRASGPARKSVKARPCISRYKLSLVTRSCTATAYDWRTYISNRGSQASRGSLRAQVRDAFRKHQGETDPVEIGKQKDAAIRGLSNYMFYEAQRMAKEGEEVGEKDG